MRRLRDPVAGGNRGDGGGEWTRESPDRTFGFGRASRLRRRALAIEGSADRPHRDREMRGGPVGQASAATPNEGGTAEGSTFRPGDEGSFCFSGIGARRPQPGGP